MASGDWREDWVRYVRAYHIPDFRNWKNDEAYKLELNRLLDSLKNPAKPDVERPCEASFLLSHSRTSIDRGLPIGPRRDLDFL